MHHLSLVHVTCDSYKRIKEAMVHQTYCWCGAMADSVDTSLSQVWLSCALVRADSFPHSLVSMLELLLLRVSLSPAANPSMRDLATHDRASASFL